MKLNLRKASVVQQTIVDEIKRISDEKSTVSVSFFEADVQARLDEQLAKYAATSVRIGRLLEANAYLRAVVAKKNAEVGISDYLAEESKLASVEARLKVVTVLECRKDIGSLNKELEARAAPSAERSIYGRSSGEYSVEVNVVPKEVVEQAKVELEHVRRRRRKIKDEMVSINVRTEFEVPEQVALVLTELGLD